MYQLEPLDAGESGPCECCGGLTRTVTGLVYHHGIPQAGYRVAWTAGQVARHGAEFILITGPWGGESSAADRSAVTLVLVEGGEGAGSSFLVVDSKPPEPSLAGRGLRREEVIGTPLATEVFRIVDFLWLYDGRLTEVTGLPDGTACVCGSHEGDLEEEEAPDFSDVPGFGEGPGPELPEPPPTRLMVIGTWLVGGLFLAGGAGIFTLSSDIASKSFAAFVAVTALAFIIPVTHRFFAEKKQKP